ncbi:MAG: glutamine amidotransferase [Candidatus Binatia bacterium]|nr:glutamine amidotransferase [Candidatus Binatia bacterium]
MIGLEDRRELHRGSLRRTVAGVMVAAARASRSVVAIRHVPFEDLGICEAILRQRGYAVSYRDAGVDALTDETVRKADLLVVLGGPIGAYEEDRYPFLRDELRLLEERCARDRPTLGVCLGAQLLARSLGGRVFPLGAKEIGFGALELTSEGERSPLRYLKDQPVLHWHGDTYTLPTGARRLASTRLCREQAFDWGKNLLALQFHLEWDWPRFEQWLIGHAVELAAAQLDLRGLRAQARDYAASTIAARRRCVEGWLHSVEEAMGHGSKEDGRHASGEESV